jgi:CHASE3 domain sensor protein
VKKINSQADVMADWEELIQAVQSDPEVQPSVDTNRQSLAQSLTQMQTLKARQNELRGLRQEVTQQIAATVEQGRETAIKIRSVVKGMIGPKSERLVHFNIPPSRKHKRKAKDPNGGAPEPTPAPSATPSGKGAN